MRGGDWIAFQEGALFTAVFLTAVAVYLIERDFLRAFTWSLPLVVCTHFGLIHSAELGVGMGGELSLGYALFGGTILFMHLNSRQGRGAAAAP